MKTAAEQLEWLESVAIGGTRLRREDGYGIGSGLWYLWLPQVGHWLSAPLLFAVIAKAQQEEVFRAK